MKQTMCELVSISIPAFNEPDLLRRAIRSVAEQDYRPIEIILSDDNSPKSLEGIASEFHHLNSKSFKIIYQRNQENLRTYWNMWTAYGRCTGKYYAVLPHDDYYISNTFISSSVRQLEENNGVYLAISNSVIEGELSLMSPWTYGGWTLVDGKIYASQHLWDKFHPAYSGVLMDNERLRALDYESYGIAKQDAQAMGLEPDESFLSILLLSTAGRVALSGEVMSVRGNPPNSYSKSDFWQATKNEAVFVQLYKLCLKTEDKSLKAIVIRVIFQRYLKFKRLNFKLVSYFDSRPIYTTLLILRGRVKYIADTWTSWIIAKLWLPRRAMNFLARFI